MSRFRDVGEAYLLIQASPTAQTPWPNPLAFMVALSKLMSLAEGQPLTHGLQLAVWAGRLGQLTGLDEAAQHALLEAALLHDIALLPLGNRSMDTEQYPLALHPLAVAQGQANEMPGLARHLYFPQELARWLHLSPEVPKAIAYHHTFANKSGLHPDVPRLEPPALWQNLLTLSDWLLALTNHPSLKGLDARQMAAHKALAEVAPGWFYPEALEAAQQLVGDADSFRPKDARRLMQDLVVLAPAPLQNAPALNAFEILHLSRWVGSQVDARLPQFTQDEAVRTADVLVQMGRAMQMSLEDLGQLAIAGYLHDIGKVALPPDVLTSERCLTGHDKDTQARHVQVAEAILKELPGFETVAHWIGAHHEALNGSGYPYGRRRAEIPVGARMLAIADAYVALTGARPFRPMPYRAQDALDLLRQQQGRLYDPSLLKILETAVAAHGGLAPKA